MHYFSLFSGIGGFELGIENAYAALRHDDRSTIGRSKSNPPGKERQGLQPAQRKSPRAAKGSAGPGTADIPHQRPLCIGYSETDRYAIKVYQSHFPSHANYGDITRIDAKALPDFDLLVAGFPCQSFSIAGKRRGFADTRGTLFFDLLRIVKEKRPRLLLLENVKGLLSHDEGRTFRTILAALDALGYDLEWHVLNSKDFGVPQHRERVFIVGHRRGTARPEVFPFGSHDRTNPVLPTLTARYWAAQANGGYIGHSPTARNEYRIRRLTPLECERLQGFPDGWTEGISDAQRYKCLGNAVTVNVIEAICKKLLQNQLLQSLIRP